MTLLSTRRTREITAALLVTTLWVPVYAADEEFTLAQAIPNDVLLYAAGKHKPPDEIASTMTGQRFSRRPNRAVLGTIFGG